MRRINPRKVNSEPRWRKQHIRNPTTNRCVQCGKLYFTRMSDAVKVASTLTGIYGKHHYVYKAHGVLHTTTHPQEDTGLDRS